MNRDTYNHLMSKLAVSFGKKLDDGTSEAYWGALKNYEEQELSEAITKAIQTEERFPKCPKLGEYIYEIRKTSPQRPAIMWSFLCPRCEEPLTVLKWQLERDSQIECRRDFVYGVPQAYPCKTKWSSQLLLRLARECKNQMDIIIIPH